MNFAFTEDQESLREQARDFLARHSGSEDVRRAMESEAGYDAGLWKRIGAERAGPAVRARGLRRRRARAVELTALMECMGGALLCAPFFSTQCLALPAILEAGSEAQKQEQLPALAEGSVTAALAVAEPGDRSEPAQLESVFRAAPGGGFTLHGVKRHVVDGHTAELLVIAARREGSRGDDGLELFLVPGESVGLARRALRTMDLTAGWPS